MPTSKRDMASLVQERGGGAETATGACPCGLCCGTVCVVSSAWHRTLKRKMDERETETRVGGEAGTGVARVEITDEVAALRGALVSHRQSVQKLEEELEEERSAARSAATEAMAMILRLQREKSKVVMEARQFKCFAEDKMAQNQREIAALEGELFKCEEAVQALSCEVHAYRRCLLSDGIGIDCVTPSSSASMDDCSASEFDLLPGYCPQLRCTDGAALNRCKFPSAALPCEHLRELEQQTYRSARMPNHKSSEVMDKRVVVGQLPRHQPSYSFKYSNREGFPATADYASNCGGRDDLGDRVFTVDVHGATDDYGMSREDAEIRKLYMRIQVLEADREFMRNTLLSLGTYKSQMMLLKEDAQQKYKEGASEKRTKEMTPSVKRFSFSLMIKSIFSFFWRKKSSRIRYTFGLSPSNIGLLLLLDNSPLTTHPMLFTRALVVASISCHIMFSQQRLL